MTRRSTCARRENGIICWWPSKEMPMQAPCFMHSDPFALLIGAVLVNVASFVAFSYLDWLCTFLIGSIGITSIVRMELNGGQAIVK